MLMLGKPSVVKIDGDDSLVQSIVAYHNVILTLNPKILSLETINREGK